MRITKAQLDDLVREAVAISVQIETSKKRQKVFYEHQARVLAVLLKTGHTQFKIRGSTLVIEDQYKSTNTVFRAVGISRFRLVVL